jgi:uncharacterized protein (DUF736 family)|tara:strand:+ start:786 stop:989 length:204 start_codon:yes stop_codon:yes gene_type:complete
MYEHKENSGSIFRNDKEGKEARPDYTGTAKVDGVDYRVASWVNTTQEGKEYLSLKFELQKETNNNPF